MLMTDCPYLNTRSGKPITPIDFSQYTKSKPTSLSKIEEDVIHDTTKFKPHLEDKSNDNFFVHLVKKYLDKKDREALGKDSLIYTDLASDTDQDSVQDSEIDSGNETDTDNDIETPKKDKDEIIIETNYSRYEKKYYRSLGECDRQRIREVEKKIEKLDDNEIPFRFKILDTPLDDWTKKSIIDKYDLYLSLDERDGEYYKLSEWIYHVEKLPFGLYQLNRDTSKPDMLVKAKQCLDKAVYGHEHSKVEILKLLGNGLSNPQYKGGILGLQGPMGNGKTSLIKRGLANALDRPFYFIGLGGMTDCHTFVGHSYTYEGAQPGLLVKALQHCKVMNPIIYFDELDKVSNTAKGEEIYHLLCHITDPTQNSEYQDKYLSDIKIDLSQVIFVFSFNDKSKINPILLDRLKVIETKGYTSLEKVKITEEYLLQEICLNINFDRQRILLSSNVIEYIIEKHTHEEGVRGLKKCLENLISYLNLIELLDYQNDLNGLLKIKELCLPKAIKVNKDSKIEITKEMVDILSSKTQQDTFSYLYS